MERINKKQNGIDVAVLLIFFNRPSLFQKVFEQVRIARPSKLFLYQDGARANRPNDIDGIKKCREIAAEIDWECDVHQFYQDKNMGCDPSEFIAQKWAFSQVDKCIVLEDDDVPSQSFFPFCKELLDKYENDTRINIICGMNHLGVYDKAEYDYLFSYYGSIWGWASWSRVVNQWNDEYSMLMDLQKREFFIKANKNKRIMKDFVKTALRHKKSGRAHYETINAYNMMINNTINIVPTRNMISNIGNTCTESTHSFSDERLVPRGSRRILSMQVYEYTFPLKHPQYVMEDLEYKKQYLKIMSFGHPLIALGRRIESWILLIRYGQFKTIKQKILKKFGK